MFERVGGWLPEPWRAYWLRWLNRRIPPASHLRLSQRSIFIFPTRRGLGLALVVVLLLLVATNYENSLVFAVAFWLLGMGLVSIFHTYANLAGISLRAMPARPVFAGQQGVVTVSVMGEGRHRPGVVLNWPGEQTHTCEVPAQDQVLVNLSLSAPRRGWIKPGRLRIGSCYPMGWLWAWSWPDLDVALLAYPHPEPGPWPDASGGEGEGVAPRHGGHDFAGYSPYQRGDAPRDVAWRAFARGMPLQTQRYAGGEQRQHWLRWSDFQPLGTEPGLSRMCWWALELARQEQSFGLELATLTITQGTGEAHLQQVLRALAEFSG